MSLTATVLILLLITSLYCPLAYQEITRIAVASIKNSNVWTRTSTTHKISWSTSLQGRLADLLRPLRDLRNRGNRLINMRLGVERPNREPHPPCISTSPSCSCTSGAQCRPVVSRYRNRHPASCRHSPPRIRQHSSSRRQMILERVATVHRDPVDLVEPVHQLLRELHLKSMNASTPPCSSIIPARPRATPPDHVGRAVLHPYGYSSR